MKSFTLVCLFAVLAVALGDEKYTSKYDNVNIQEIVENRRLLLSYYKCIMDEGNCTPEGLELKSHIKDALETKCAKCTEAQQGGVRTMIKHLINNEAELWDKLCGKYDPKNLYRGMYEKELKEIKSS